MFSWPHCPGIDVHVRIYFNGGNFQTGRLQEEAGGRS